MGTPLPRHLARPQGRSGPLRRQLLTAGVALAAVLAAALATVALTRGPGPARHAAPRPRAGPTPAPTRAPTRAPGTAPGSTFPPVVAMPENLLDNGDLEGGLSGWSPLGGAALTRQSPGHSGRWALAFSVASSTTAPAGQAPGVTFADLTTSRAGRTYQATAWLRADRPGTAVALALREVPAQGGAPISADVVGLTLPAAGAWQQLAVVHQARTPGARLVLELTATRLPAGGHVTADQLDVESSQN